MLTKPTNSQIATTIALSASTVTSFSAAVYFLIKPKRLKDPVKRIMFFQHMSGFIAAMSWNLNMWFPETCPGFVFTNMYGVLSASAWNCGIGFVVLTMSKSPNLTKLNSMFPKLVFFCSGLTAIPPILAVFIGGISIRPYAGCWLGMNQALYLMSVWRYLFVSIAIVIFILTVVTIKKRWKTTSIANKSTVTFNDGNTSVTIPKAAVRQIELLFIQLACFAFFSVGTIFQAVQSDTLFPIALFLSAFQPTVNAVLANYRRVIKNVRKGMGKSTSTSSPQGSNDLENGKAKNHDSLGRSNEMDAFSRTTSITVTTEDN